jgi:CHAT domain-containing protein
VAATVAGVVAGDAAGTVWMLDWPLARVAPPPEPKPPREPRPPRRQVILFLAANPEDTPRLALDEECAAIEGELRAAPARGDFEFRSKWAVSIDELMRHLNELQPAILHFSGHGTNADIRFRQELHRLPATHRDVTAASGGGIELHGEHHQSRHMPADVLRRMIWTTAPSVRLVVLNACFSDGMADALGGVVDCVVGMRGTIGDGAARVFSAAFYRALGHRRSVDNALQQAVVALAARQLPDEHVPVSRTRDGIQADQIFFARRDGQES